MKRSLSYIVGILMFAIAGAVAARGFNLLPPNPDYEFVGYTDEVSATSLQLHEKHALCQIKFDRRARMATTEEYVLSPNATPPSDRALILPTLVGLGLDITGASTDPQYPDLQTGSFLGYCNVPFPGTSSGMVTTVIETSGRISLILCSDGGGLIACSAPGGRHKLR